MADDPFATKVASTLGALDIDNLDPGVEYEIQVRAISSEGIASDWTDSIWFTTPDDVTPPSIPSAPIVTSKLGVFSIKWDGLTEFGASMEPDFDHIAIYASGIYVGSVSLPSDEVIWATAQYNLDYNFTATALDTTGNESEGSAITVGQVTPLVSDDILGKIIDGSTMVVDGSIGADSIAAGAVTATKIAAHAITADKISAGAIDGMQITGNTIIGGSFLTSGRSSAGDGKMGWYLASSGYANVNALDGSTFLIINPKDSNQYFQVGDPAGSYLKYTVNTGKFDVNANLNVGNGNALTTGNRTSSSDAQTGWYFSGNGYCNVYDPEGNRFLTVNPKDATRYFQVGDTASGNYLRYTVNTATLDLRASTATLGQTTGSGGTSLQINSTGFNFLPSEYWNSGSSVTDTARVQFTWKGMSFYTSSSPSAPTLSITSNMWDDNSALLDVPTGSVITKGLWVKTHLFGRYIASDNSGYLTIGSNWTNTSLNTGNPSGVASGAESPNAGFTFRDTTTATTVTSYGIVSNVSDLSANVRISGSGVLQLGNTSASKYKVNISEQDWGESILDLQPKNWYSKKESEYLAEILDKAGGDPSRAELLPEEDPAPLRATPGLIAEDVESVGLSDFVEYDLDGEVHALYYDRLWVPLIPIVRRQRDEIADLKTRLQALESAQ